MKYCSTCGAEVSQQIPPDDNRPRYVCLSCRTVHYQNPRVVAGCLAEHEGRVLLCKRAIDPRYGYWTLPAGFMELGETTLEGALRETREEANANVEVLELYMVLNLPHVDQVYMMFRSKLKDLDFSPGDETLEVDLFSENEVPWDELAFRTIRETLRCFFRDRETGQFRLHTGDIVKTGNGYDFRAAPQDGRT